MAQILYIDGYEGGGYPANLNQIPESCPLCGSAIGPQNIVARLLCGRNFPGSPIKLVFRCSNHDCGAVFVAHYVYSERFDSPRYYVNQDTVALPLKPLQFHSLIHRISPRFISVYAEASTAEYDRKLEIAGDGYRKALEFLVKDYLIYKDPGCKSTVSRAPFARCINQNIEDGLFKECIKRAIWIGNDETHTQRKWLNVDLSDLGKLVRVIAEWIVLIETANEYVNKMPES